MFQDRTQEDCARESFTQNWAAYRDGFGDLVDFSCDFWLGLEQMYRITNIPGRQYTLDSTFKTQNTSMLPYYQSYLTGFYIENEINNYKLHSSGFYLGQ